MKSILTIFCVFFVLGVNAQISGETNPTIGPTYYYQYYTTTQFSNASWSVTGGTVTNSYYSVEEGYTAIIVFSSAGQQTVTFGSFGGGLPFIFDEHDVTVSAPLVAGSISASTATTICYNTNPGNINNSSSASGGSGTYSYQWQQKIGNGSWTNTGSATSSPTSINPPSLTGDRRYRRRVTSGGQTKYSNVIFYDVYGNLSGGTISYSGGSIGRGSAPSAISGNTPSGGNGTKTYTWQKKTTGGYSNISNTNSVSYQPGIQQESTTYRRKVVSCGQTKYSNEILIRVNVIIEGPNVRDPSNTTTYISQKEGESFLQPFWSLSGGGTITNTWTGTADGIPTEFATVNWTTPGNHTLTMNYDLGKTVVHSIYVNPVLSPGSVSASSATTICYNGNPGTINNSGSASGGNGTYSYQWMYKDDGGSWTNVGSATSSPASIDPPALTADRQYRRKVTSGSQVKYSNIITYSVNDQLVAGTINYSGGSIDPGNTPAQITGGSPSGGYGGYTYTWEKKTTGRYAAISGATGISLSPGSLNVNTTFQRIAHSCGESKASNEITITVNLSPGTVGNDQGVCPFVEEIDPLVELTAPTGGSGSYTYQWYKQERDPNTGNWPNGLPLGITGATSATYAPPPQANVRYQRRVFSDGEFVASNWVTIDELPMQTYYEDQDQDGFGTTTAQFCAGSNPPGYATVGGDCDDQDDTIHPNTVWYADADLDTYGNASSPWVGCSPPQNYVQNSADCDDGNALIHPATVWYHDEDLDGFGNIADVTTGCLQPSNYVLNSDDECPNSYGPFSGCSNFNLNLGNTNHVLTRTFREPVDLQTYDQNDLTIDLLFNVAYMDGLGRPIQSSLPKQSPGLNDIISIQAYDSNGRVTKSYLPYTKDNDGAYDATAAINIMSFYAGTIEGKESTSYPYAETVLENYPNGKVLRAGAPGESWQFNEFLPQLEHVATNEYILATTSEVLRWSVSSGLPDTGSNYPNHSIQKYISQDEDNNQTITYTDPNGQTILKKSQVDGSTWASTYYVYDIYGQLKVVFPPEATDRLSTEYFGQSEANKKAFLNTWAFLYDYDGRNRMVMKKVPGADSVLLVYDRWNRLVLTQDGNLRDNNQWLFTKYDRLNRLVITGKATILLSASAIADTLETTPQVRYESFSPGGILQYSGNDYVYPPDSLVDEYLTVTYYDNYDWDNSTVAYTNPVGLNRNTDVKGQVTGTLTKAGNDSWITSASYYDDRYRVIQAVSTNHLGGSDVVTNYYDFIGQVNRSISTHTNVDTTYTTIRSFVYDHAGRLLETWHKLESASDSVLLAKNRYNELGELIEKDLHGETGGVFAQSLDYSYNIRGWLTGMNSSDLSLSQDGDLFGMELFYDAIDASGDIANSQNFNGNISAIKWSTGNDQEWYNTEERAYRFQYDGLNRLKSALSNMNTVNWKVTDDYRSEYSYDGNGNIISLERRNNKGSHIDSLTYSYDGNQLQEVADVADSLGFYDGNTSGNDYAYDANGNMVKDRNKGIDSIYYNHLNLPIIVDFENAGDSIVYLYDAAGIKLQQQVYQEGSLMKTTDYVGEFIYETDTSGIRELQLVQHEEGRIVPVILSSSEGSWDYQYHLKDHLGNVRLTFSTTPENYTMTETFETGEENGWQDLHRSANSNANTTIGGDEVELLQSGQTGAMIFLSVNKWDTVNLSIQANYESAPSNNNFLGTGYNALFSSFDNVFGSGVENGVSSTSTVFDDALSGTDMSGKGNTSTAPRAFLNYIIFDKDMSYVTAGFQQISTSALGVGVHETISINDIIADREGYLLAYLSNENQEAVNVHFDDFTVYHGKTNVVSTQDYYPFGLTFNESVRVASTEQNFLLTSNERLPDWGVGVSDFNARTYDASIGRFYQVDPLAEMNQKSWNPYHFTFNNPLRFNDPTGMTSTEEWKEENGITDSDVTTVYQAPTDEDDKSENTEQQSETGSESEVPAFIRFLSKHITALQILYEDNQEPIDTQVDYYYQLFGSGLYADVDASVGDKIADIGYTVALAQGIAFIKVGRRGAFRKAKRDAKIPMSSKPINVRKVPMTNSKGKQVLDSSGKPIYTREYTYRNSDGKEIVIQDHSAGHIFDDGGRVGSHFNVRSGDGSGASFRNSSVKGTEKHYNFRGQPRKGN